MCYPLKIKTIIIIIIIIILPKSAHGSPTFDTGAYTNSTWANVNR